MIDFVIAGQPKSGTTALAQFLSEHPDVCIANPKEPGFFATDLQIESDRYHGKQRYFRIRTEQDYKKCFSHAVPDQILGDASTCYTFSSMAAENIHRANPEAKIIIMLRNPVDFIHSLHMQYVNETVESETDFEKALALEEKRKKNQSIPPRTRCPSYHYYRERTHYAKQVKRYFDIFGQGNVFVISNEEFRNNNADIYRQVLEFLDIDTEFQPDFQTVHGSKSPRFPLLNKFANTMWIKKIFYKLLGAQLYTALQKKLQNVLLKKASRQNMNRKLKEKLKKELADEVKKISQLTGKDYAYLWGYGDDTAGKAK